MLGVLNLSFLYNVSEQLGNTIAGLDKLVNNNNDAALLSGTYHDRPTYVVMEKETVKAKVKKEKVAAKAAENERIRVEKETAEAKAREEKAAAEAEKERIRMEKETAEAKAREEKAFKFREPTDGSIKSISLLGERNSGTRWIYGDLGFVSTTPFRFLSPYLVISIGSNTMMLKKYPRTH